jgi:DNA-binding response OmpR family regulator
MLLLSFGNARYFSPGGCVMSGACILVVDDDESVRAFLRDALEVEGYTVLVAADGVEALRTYGKESPDLIILDILMPVMDGFQVLEQLRLESDIPVIMLSALNEEEDRIKAFELGADDYVNKASLRLAELVKRVEAVLRRTAKAAVAARPFDDGYLAIDFTKHRVTVRGSEVKLTPKEYLLLRELASRPGQALEYEQLLETVWGETYNDARELLHDHINRLRKKIEPEPSKPRYIINLPKFGYRFDIP